MGLLPRDAATETGLLSGAGPVFIAPCVLALQALESDHLKLQARQCSHTKTGARPTVSRAV